MSSKNIFIAFFLFGLTLQLPFQQGALAQDVLPYDNGLSTYHSGPKYRESESHPLRVFAYAVHPIGWALREGVFRPLSYFASSTAMTRSVMGYRYPFDYRQPECFSADESVPDCRALAPFNYEPAGSDGQDGASALAGSSAQVYMPDVNFDFDVRKLNELGRGRTKQIAELIKKDTAVKVVLEGHADYIGGDKYNEKLGLDRAEAVRQELINLGVVADRLSTVTFGESKPVFTEQEDWARAINRRVEVHPSE